jgi:hypothetical protein
MLMSGCAVPVWLVDAEGIGALVVEAAGSITAFIAGLTGDSVIAAIGTAVSAWGAKVEAGLKNVNGLIENYKTTPGESLLAEIDAAAQEVSADITTLGTIEGIPPAVLTVLQSWATQITNELNSLVSLLPLAQAKPTAGSLATVQFPTLKADFIAAHNAVLTTPSGHAGVDAVLSTVKPL